MPRRSGLPVGYTDDRGFTSQVTEFRSYIQRGVLVGASFGFLELINVGGFWGFFVA